MGEKSRVDFLDVNYTEADIFTRAGVQLLSGEMHLLQEENEGEEQDSFCMDMTILL